MSIESQIEREEQYLEDQLANGEISISEYRSEMKEIQREYRACAREAAENAYDDVIRNW